MNLREQYNREGYVIIRDAVSPDMMLPNEREFKSMLDDDAYKYIRYLKANAKHIEAQRLFLEIYKFKYIISNAIIVDQPVLHVMSSALRIPDGYYGTDAHQDWPSTQGSLDCVTVWIALTDAGIGNFPLEVIPGSHKQGLKEGKLNGSVLEIECDDKQFVPVECKAGDAVIFSGFTIHRTGQGSGFRAAISQRFDNADEPTFIDRGYPCAQKRVVDREIRWKPTVDQVRKIFE